MQPVAIAPVVIANTATTGGAKSDTNDLLELDNVAPVVEEASWSKLQVIYTCTPFSLFDVM